MGNANRIDIREFLDVVTPALASGDVGKLAHSVRSRWRPREVACLLRHDNSELRRAAAVALAFVGDEACIGPLTRALHDDDWRVNDVAEHALWSIWFRAGNHAATEPFQQGLCYLNAEDYGRAIACFREASRLDPNFAEPHNQRGIAQFLNGEYPECIDACRRTIERMPCHFGAFAGMGHCHVQLGEIEPAVQCYRRALRINPRMPAVAQAVDRLQNTLNEMLHSSGAFDGDFSRA